MPGNLLLGFIVSVMWALVWIIPFRKNIYEWYDQRWGR